MWKKRLRTTNGLTFLCIQTLDALEELFPFPNDIESDYSALGVWLDDARSQGLISRVEVSNLRGELVHCI